MTHAQRSSFSCPRCATYAGTNAPPPLFMGTAGGLTLHACGMCGGVFLGTACARRLAEALPAQAIALAGQAAHGARYVPDTTVQIACPMCRKPMQRTHAAGAKVDLDICATHGTWYDRDEMRRIAESLRASGWHSPAGQAAVVGGAAMAGVATAGMVASSGPGPMGSPVAETVAQTAGEVAVEVGAEVAIEGLFGILGALFD